MAVGPRWHQSDLEAGRDTHAIRSRDDDEDDDYDNDHDDDDLYIIGAVCGSRKMSTSSWECPVTT